MAPFAAYIENTLGYLFSSVKGHDAKLLSRTSATLAGIKPDVSISSSELGASSPGKFTAGKHELLGKNLFPELSWTLPQVEAEHVQSWLLVIEDADAPLPSPIVHGIYYDIPAATHTLTSSNFEEDEANPGMLKGGFKFGANRRGTIWTGPRPVLGHGNHRYFFTLIGLNAASYECGDAKITKELLLDQNSGLEGKVVCWGEYVASFERKL